jgi:hypothetical protein
MTNEALRDQRLASEGSSDAMLPWAPGAQSAGMVFLPVTCRTRWEGVAVTVWLILIDLLLLVSMWRRPIDWMKFGLIVLMVLSVPLILHLAYRTWAAFTLEYWVDRNSITVHWANSRQVIPLESVHRMIRGGVSSLGGSGVLEWPAPYLGGSGRALGLVNIIMLATRPLSESLLLETDEAVYAFSPADEEGFLAAIQVRHKLRPVSEVEAVAVRSSLWNRTAAADPVGTLLFAGGMVGVLILFGVLMLSFQNLPDALAFHYNAQGEPDVVREKQALFLLPFIGLLAWLANGAWGLWMAMRDQRPAAYMLWGGAIIVQVFSFLALYSLMY